MVIGRVLQFCSSTREMHVHVYKLIQAFEGKWLFGVLKYHPYKSYLNSLNPSGYFMHHEV